MRHVSPWRSFLEVNDLSDDGRVIVGTGLLLDGSVAGFRAVIPAPPSVGLLALAAISGPRRRRLAN